MVDILYYFLPLSAKSDKAVTFSSIFANSRIEDYLKGPDNKRQALQKGFENLLRYHERLPWTIIRKIVPAAIVYRKYIRDPLKQVEVDNLAQCLLNLGIDMREEFNRLKIDETLPRITVPPERLLKQLRNHDLDPSISAEPLELFRDGHYNEAVRRACEKFEAKVQKLSSLLDKCGRALMGQVFSTITHIDTTGIEDCNKQDFIDGYKHLAMGAMAAIRNVFSHGDQERRSPEECYEMLLFLNWMFRFVK